MSRQLKRLLAATLVVVFATAFGFESSAEARRYRARGVYRAPVYPVYVGRGVAVRAPFVGVRVNRFGGVRVAAPGVRVGVGF